MTAAAEPLSDDLALAWVDGPQALLAHEGEWRDLAARTGAEIFLTPLWFRSWMATTGKDRQVTSLLARRDGRLVGLLPFQIDRLWLGPIPVRIARLAGSDPHSLNFTLPVEPAFRLTFLRAALQGLMSRSRCAAISLTPVSGRADFLADLRDAARSLAPATLTDTVIDSHVVFDLPDTFEGYLTGQLSKSRRSQFRQHVKRLETEYALLDRSFTPTSADFAAFEEMHARQWQAMGKGGHFSDWPGMSALFRHLADHSSPGEGVAFDSQSGNFGPIYTQFALMSGKRCHWRLPARSLDDRAEKLSMGNIGMGLSIRHLIAAGVTTIEAGRGKYDYKIAYGGQDVPVFRILISRRTPRLLLAWANLLDLCYYRIWFKRLAPRLRKTLGLAPPPLRQFWIGSRI